MTHPKAFGLALKFQTNAPAHGVSGGLLKVMDQNATSFFLLEG